MSNMKTGGDSEGVFVAKAGPRSMWGGGTDWRVSRQSSPPAVPRSTPSQSRIRVVQEERVLRAFAHEAASSHKTGSR